MDGGARVVGCVLMGVGGMGVSVKRLEFIASPSLGFRLFVWASRALYDITTTSELRAVVCSGWR